MDLFKDVSPGKMVVRMATEVSAISGLLDALAIALTACLQHGDALSELCSYFEQMQFAQSG